MRVAFLVLVGGFSLSGSAALSAENDPYVCAMSGQEAALVQTTRKRIRKLPSSNKFADIESRIPIVGCGLWSLTVSRSGAVVSARLVRQETIGNYEGVVRPWITLVTFKPSRGGWTGLMKIKLAEPEGN